MELRLELCIATLRARKSWHFDEVLQDDWVKKYGSHNEAKEEEKPAPTKHSTSISSQTTAASVQLLFAEMNYIQDTW